MSQHALNVSIASITEPLFVGEADSVTVPGVSGEMTILANHEAIITTLKPGVVIVRVNGEKKQFAVTHGVLEVSNNTANVLL